MQSPVALQAPAQLLIIDFFSNGSLRLSPGERGRHAMLGKMQSPVALELLELLATTNIPQDHLVIRRTDEKLRIRGAELDAIDALAAIFPNARFLVNFSTPLPR